MKLSDKNILLIAPKFFNCDRSIEDELRDRGAKVHRLTDRPFDSIVFKLLSKIAPNVISILLIPYYIYKLRKISGQLSYVLVINGQTLHRKVLKYIRSKYMPNSITLYMWDSMENRPSIKNSLPVYDRLFSFDPDSCRKYSMEFRPLFYSNEIRENTSDSCEFDLAFIGTCHSDRFQVLQLIKKRIDVKRLFIYLYLQSYLVFFVYKYFFNKYPGVGKDYFKYQPLASKDAENVLKSTRILIDIEHPNQKGLTIRNIDYLTFGKKIITTNPEVKNYDFYESGNILVIDRFDPKIPDSFISSPFIPYSEKMLYRYSITSFINDCLFSKLGEKYGHK